MKEELWRRRLQWNNQGEKGIEGIEGIEEKGVEGV